MWYLWSPIVAWLVKMPQGSVQPVGSGLLEDLVGSFSHSPSKRGYNLGGPFGGWILRDTGVLVRRRHNQSKSDRIAKAHSGSSAARTYPSVAASECSAATAPVQPPAFFASFGGQRPPWPLYYIHQPDLTGLRLPKLHREERRLSRGNESRKRKHPNKLGT